MPVRSLETLAAAMSSRALVRIVALLLLVVVASACTPSNTRGTSTNPVVPDPTPSPTPSPSPSPTPAPSPEPTLLFSDMFDGGLGNWVLSDVNRVVVDGDVGAPSAPSMRFQDGMASATLDAGAFSPADGLRMCVRVRPPSDDLCGNNNVGAVLGSLDITRITGSPIAATIQFNRSNCNSGSYTEFWYKFGQTTANREQFGMGQVMGQFFDFCFSIDANGNASWLRDGVTKAQSFSPLATDQLLGLQLTGLLLGADAWSIHFDDVRIDRPLAARSE